MPAQLDHLVIAAASLADGVQWCETTLGITPGPGGEHPLMGTHNRLFTLASPAFPTAYLEIIAIHSGASWARRWFDLDNADFQQELSQNGPKLVHFVASTTQASLGVEALAGLGLDRGLLLEASRMTPHGLLEWKIAVRDDGQRLLNGALPTLIEWGAVHPTQTMAPSGVTLQSLQLSHPQAQLLRAAYAAIGLDATPGYLDITQGPPNITATLQTPKGAVQLHSHGI